MILQIKDWFVAIGLLHAFMFGVEWDLDMKYIAFSIGPIRIFIGKMFDDFDDDFYDKLEKALEEAIKDEEKK